MTIDLLTQILAAGLPRPVAELEFRLGRRWRFDFAWFAERLAVEVDGATFAGGRHTRGKGYEEDCVKLNAAVLDGWRVLRFTTRMVEDGRALAAVTAALEA
jgi:very-short-patch-repair endonuclease